MLDDCTVDNEAYYEHLREKEILETKRSFNIAQKEAKRKKLEEEKNKERKRKIFARKEESKTHASSDVDLNKLYREEMRMAKQRERVENEAKQRTRETNCKLRHENWLYNANLYIRDLLVTQKEDAAKLKKKLRAAKDRQLDKFRQQSHNRGLERTKLANLEARREYKEAERDENRFEQTLISIEKLKQENEAALDKILEDVADGEPLKAQKCALVASINSTPTVSELLAARKLQSLNLEDLRQSNIEQRARINKKSLFSYVKMIDEVFEASKFPIPTGAVTRPPAGKQKKL